MVNKVELKLVTMNAEHVKIVKVPDYHKARPKAFDKRTGEQIDADVIVTYEFQRFNVARAE